MIFQSSITSRFEFVRLSALRVAQLKLGCLPRVPESAKCVVTAQREVAAGKVVASPRVAPGTGGVNAA
jgi:DNA-directed RNA polymerase subunit K/omega